MLSCHLVTVSANKNVSSQVSHVQHDRPQRHLRELHQEVSPWTRCGVHQTR